MKKFTKTLLAVCLTSLPVQAALAGPYIGLNVGAHNTSFDKAITYGTTDSNLEDRFYGFKGQLILGYNFLKSMPNYYHHSYTQTDAYDDADASESNSMGSFFHPNSSASRDDEELENQFYYALEAILTYNQGSASSSVKPWFMSTTASSVERLRYSLDVLLLFKYRMTPTYSAFFGPGASLGRFEVNTPAPTAGNLGVTGNFNRQVPGITFKAGLEMASSSNTSVTVTYQYTNYNDKKLTAIEPLTSERVNAKYHPVINSIMIGINIY